MRRGPYIVLEIAAVVAGLLFAGSVVLWARSERGVPAAGLERGGARYRIEVVEGELALAMTRGRSPGNLVVRDWGIAGFGWRAAWDTHDEPVLFHWRVTVPLWGVAGVSLVPIVWAIGAWPGRRRRARRERGLCGACGYDVRAVAHKSRCPECGRPLGDKEETTDAQDHRDGDSAAGRERSADRARG